ncbi:MAG TPA: glycerophosphodiester phosphodiesterase [Rhodospirillaceae bacterium]|nr:MAG: hypothetical protein A2018_03040 [Alphaproteobacteria bacterium GWF2_58_20]HAU29378.1 glycerophosphodiester phosphodiesterase [Rhodospirillaceae bacterium]
MTCHPFLEHEGPLAVVHRGGQSVERENSMEAFQAAHDMGFRWFETDVRASADGHLVLAHDASLGRIIGDTRPVETLDSVECARIGLVHLQELLGAFPEARVNIDPKTDAAAGLLVGELAGNLHRVCVGCFSDARIRRLRKAAGPALCTALGPREVVALGLGMLHKTDACCAQVPLHWLGVPVLEPHFLHAAHGLGLAVHAWTIDAAEEMERLLDMGVDGLMTDAPETLRDVFFARHLSLA